MQTWQSFFPPYGSIKVNDLTYLLLPWLMHSCAKVRAVSSSYQNWLSCYRYEIKSESKYHQDHVVFYQITQYNTAKIFILAWRWKHSQNETPVSKKNFPMQRERKIHTGNLHAGGPLQKRKRACKPWMGHRKKMHFTQSSKKFVQMYITYIKTAQKQFFIWY